KAGADAEQQVAITWTACRFGGCRRSQAQTRGDTWPEPDALVFPAEHGGFLRGDSLYYRLRQAMRQAGAPVEGPTGEPRGWHSLRHTYARLGLERGGSIAWLQGALGHLSIV